MVTSFILKLNANAVAANLKNDKCPQKNALIILSSKKIKIDINSNKKRKNCEEPTVAVR